MKGAQHRPRVAVSSCLLGEPVRYDGNHRRDSCITEQLSALFEWLPVCPEVGIGMGVPRAPIRLVTRGGRVHAVGVEDDTVEVTQALQDYAQRMSEQLADVSGYIFKSRSPSCGLIDTDLFDAQGYLLDKTSGVFAAVIRDIFPDLPLTDECSLADPVARDAFVQRVFDYLPSREMPR